MMTISDPMSSARDMWYMRSLMKRGVDVGGNLENGVKRPELGYHRE